MNGRDGFAVHGSRKQGCFQDILEGNALFEIVVACRPCWITPLSCHEGSVGAYLQAERFQHIPQSNSLPSYLCHPAALPLSTLGDSRFCVECAAVPRALQHCHGHRLLEPSQF